MSEQSDPMSALQVKSEGLRLNFAALNPIDFAKYLFALDLPIPIQRVWLRAKVIGDAGRT